MPWLRAAVAKMAMMLTMDAEGRETTAQACFPIFLQKDQRDVGFGPVRLGWWARLSGAPPYGAFAQNELFLMRWTVVV